MPDARTLVQGLLGDPEKPRSFNTDSKWWWWKCPLHAERKASFGVDDEAAHCFSCGFHAGPVGILMKIGGWSREKALKAVSRDRYHLIVRKRAVRMDLPPLPPALEWQEAMGQLVTDCAETIKHTSKAHRELIGRGISKEVWTKYRIGWLDETMEIEVSGEPVKVLPGLVIPAYGPDGALWAIKVRTASGIPKYYQVPGSARELLYGLRERVHDTLVIAESELCKLTVESLVPDVDAVGLRGASNRLKAWLDWIVVYDRVFLLLDGDEAGQVAAEAILEDNDWWVNRCPPDGLDPGKMAEQGYDIPALIFEGVERKIQ
jgi:hypothetical protein